MTNELFSELPAAVRKICSDFERCTRKPNYKHALTMAVLSKYSPNSREFVKKTSPYIFRKFNTNVLWGITRVKAANHDNLQRKEALTQFWDQVNRKPAANLIILGGSKSEPIARLTEAERFIELVVMLSEAYDQAQTQSRAKHTIGNVAKRQRLIKQVDTSIGVVKRLLKRIDPDWTILEVLESDAEVKKIIHSKFLVRPNIHKLPTLEVFLDMIAAMAKKELKSIFAASQLKRKHSNIHAFLATVHPYLKHNYGREMDAVISSAVGLLFGDYEYSAEHVKDWRRKRRGAKRA